MNRQEMSIPPLPITVTPELVDGYAALARDFNPIHVDEEYAAAGPFGRRVAHGMLIISLVQRAVVSLLGADWIRNGQLRVKMSSPVYVGDTIKITGTFREYDNDSILSLRLRVTNQLNQTVLTGVASGQQSI